MTTDPAAAVADPYRHLEHDDDGTRDWVAARTRAYTDWMGGQPARARWREALRELTGHGWASVPTVRGDRLFFARRPPQGQVAALVMRDRDGAERTVLDPATEPAGSAHLSVWSVAPDGSRVATLVCHGGAETGDLTVRDPDTGRILRTLPDVRSATPAWLVEKSGRPRALLYGRSSAEGDGPGLYAADLDGGPPVLLWRVPDGDGPAFLTPLVSPDGGRLLLVVRYGAEPRNAIWLAELAGPDPAGLRPRLIHPAGRSVATPRFDQRNGVCVLSHDRAETGELYQLDPRHPERDRWRLVVPADSAAVIRQFVLAGHTAVLHRTRDGVSELVAADLDRPGPVRPLPLPGRGSVGLMTAGPGDGVTAPVWFDYTDPGTPPQVYRVSVGTPAAEVGARPWSEPGGRHRPVRSTRHRCTAPDGAPVGLTVLSAEHTARPAPTILTVYGGFGRTMRLSYRADAHAWVSRGGVYVLAHIRGDGDRGPQWHHAGAGRGKLDTVRDVLAAAEYLTAAGITTPDRLAVTGVSNGGLVALAAMVASPDLFGACAVASPVADLVRFPLLGDGRSWLAEYGSPDDPEDLAALLSYSPYHNVVPGRRYPPTLLVAGAGDTRVPPAHARKMCAALRAADGADLVLYHEEADVGHAYRSHRSLVEAAADRLTFLAAQLGGPPTGQ